MVHARIILAILGFFLPQLCVAGPWPRGEGNQFLSVTIQAGVEDRFRDSEEHYGTLYYERGLKNDLTLGFDGGSDPSGTSKAIGFLRWPVGKKDGPSRLALEFGLGLFDSKPAIRPTLSWGRGITQGDVSGWVSLDTRLVIKERFEGLLQADFTYGLKPGQRDMVILELQTGQPSVGEFYARVAPSYVREFRPGHRFQIGLIAGLTGSDAFKLKLGYWRDF